MSVRHPIIGVTGSSGAGTSRVVRVFQRMFESLSLRAALIEGDAFHAYDRAQHRAALERARIRGENFSLFAPGTNLLDRLDALLRDYGERGTGMKRHYLHTDAEAMEADLPVGSFTPWEPIAPNTDLLFYEGLHGAFVGGDFDIAGRMDLLVGVVPVINLEWIQKLCRDTDERGYEAEDVMKTILRRMPDYVNHIVPQFSRTDINFQRVPLVDTSNPFAVREIPTPDQSLVVIHFNDNARIAVDFETLIPKLKGAFRSHARTLVVPGRQMEHAIEVILKPTIERLVRERR